MARAAPGTAINAAFGQMVQGMAVVRALHAKAQAQQFIDPPIPIRRVRRVASP